MTDTSMLTHARRLVPPANPALAEQGVETSFHQFQHLPTELRLHIWDLVPMEGRVIHLQIF